MTIKTFLHERKGRLFYSKSRIILLCGGFCLSVLFLSLHHSSPFSKLVVQNSSRSYMEQPPCIDRASGDGFCQKIIDDPQPWYKRCKRNETTMSCQNDPKKFPMFSQFKQDWYLYTAHFKNLKRPGYYLDIATNEPVRISNTFFFDRCLKWNGVCIEANKVYTNRIRRQRSCELINTCVSKNDGEIVTFGKHAVLGGILGSTYKFGDRFDNDTKAMEQLRCTNVSTILINNKAKVIDYLSLDVEGHELVTLQGIDWTKTIINVMSIETSLDENIESIITEFLEPLGYKRHIPERSQAFRKGRIGKDIVFLHQDVEFGRPV